MHHIPVLQISRLSSCQGTQLVQELHRWLGPALDAHLADLKPVQQKELAEAFAGESLPTQTRFTLVQQREKALQEAEAALTANEAGTMGTEEKSPVDNEPEDIQVDGYDLADPQPVLNKLPQAFYENLSSAKWKDRKELALDPLLETLRRTPRIEDANYDDLVRALAGRMTDANIACVISAAGCLECLAKGLRQDFARYKSTAISPVLERCKEKKASVTDALAAALDAIFQSVSLAYVQPPVFFQSDLQPRISRSPSAISLRKSRHSRSTRIRRSRNKHIASSCEHCVPPEPPRQ